MSYALLKRTASKHWFIWNEAIREIWKIAVFSIVVGVLIFVALIVVVQFLEEIGATY